MDLILLMLGVICFIILYVCIHGYEDYDKGKEGALSEYEKEHYEIKNINTSTDQKFVLGIGTIGYNEYYTFYKKDKRGYSKDKISVEDASIVETDDKKPQVTKIMNKWDDKITRENYKDEFTGNYVIYVPKDTIIQEFKLT